MTSVALKELKDIAIIEWDDLGSKVNVLSEKSLSEFEKILDHLSKSSLKVAVLISKKPSVFIAGADLKEIQKLKTKEDFSKTISKVHQLFKKMEENKNISFISAIHGACLGGGTELTLACDYRIASLHPSTKIGLPEVQLGLIPGFGGCVRLPRLVGLVQSCRFILSGKPLDAKQAHKMGLIDKVEGIPAQLESCALKWAHEIIQGKKPKKTKDKKRVFSIFEFFPLKNLLFFLVKRQVLKKTKGFYPAPVQALSLIHKTLTWPFNKAIEEEKRVFCELAITNTSRNLIRLFFLTEDNKKCTGGIKNPPPIRRVGVLGAGVMGSGIAYVSADHDFEVRLQDVQKESLIKGRRHIHSLLKKQVHRRRINSFEEKMKQSKISYSLNFENFSIMDMIIEAVVEDMNVKKQVIRELSPFLKKSAVFVTNTSSLSVTQMSQAFEDPTRFAGLHFFNPVYRLPLVEVIRAEKTSDETLSRVIQFAKKLGKTPIIVKDSPGFLVNRLLMPWLTEALWIWGEGMKMRSIDQVFSEKFGLPMGPFRLMDEVGLDVCVKVIKNFKASGLDLSVPSFVNELISENRLGKKTSLGFYHYTEKGQARAVNTEMEIQFCSSLKNTFEKPEALQRGIYRMVNEGARVLEEQVVAEAHQVDLAMIMGAGFPPFHGGLMQYANTVGLQKIVNSLDYWSEKGFKRFEPSPLLRTKARQGKTF